MVSVLCHTLIALCLVLCSATPSVPDLLGYIRESRSPPDTTIPVLFAISQRNVATLERTLLEVSDPNHKRYGMHLTHAEVVELTTSPESTAVVVSWLKAQGYSSIIPTMTGDYIRAEASMHIVEASLPSTEFYTFSHKSLKGTKTLVRTEKWELPAALDGHVDFIGYLDDFSSPLSATPHFWWSPSAKDLKGNTTFDLVNKVYNVTSNRVRSQGGATQGVLGIGQYIDTKDFENYATRFNVQPPYSNFTITGVPNFPFECLHSPNDCLEGSLDMETIASVAQGAPTAFWLADPNSQTWFSDYMAYLVNLPNPPMVVSMSYTLTEHGVSVAAKTRFSTDAMKLGVQGTTVVSASGDDGVAGYSTRNAGKNACGFHPAFPASNPYVLTVGATNGPEADQPEVACTFKSGCLITSGGGFSDFYPRPLWQQAAVDNYLTTSGSTLPPKIMFNSTSRAYPDVSLLGHNFPTSVGGKFYLVSGTSGSAPMMAALLTLANEARLQHGQKPLGFINPALYLLWGGDMGSMLFHDITEGENNCCAAVSDPVCCDFAFTAIKGYDPVSGLGSINHGLLVEELLKMTGKA